jgi:hypothetical protein
VSAIDDLDQLFPGHRAAESEPTWEVLKSRLTIGQSVSGKVVAKSHFGAWIDLGVGFPGMLEIIVMADLKPERYRAGDWCLIGSEVTAFIGSFRDYSHQIRLWQVPLGSRSGRFQSSRDVLEDHRDGTCDSPRV